MTDGVFLPLGSGKFLTLHKKKIENLFKSTCIKTHCYLLFILVSVTMLQYISEKFGGIMSWGAVHVVLPSAVDGI